MSTEGRPALHPQAPHRGTSRAAGPVRTAVGLLWTKAALALVGIVVTFLVQDEITEAVAGDPALPAGTAELATTAGVIGGVVSGLVGAALWALCAVFVARGHGWARVVATVLAGLGALTGLLGLLGSAVASAVPATAAPVPVPALSLVLTLLGLAVSVAILVVLWLRPVNAFFREAAAARAAHRTPLA